VGRPGRSGADEPGTPAGSEPGPGRGGDAEIPPHRQLTVCRKNQKTFVWQYSIILKGAKVGTNCNINAHCFIENDVIVGDNVTVKCGVQLWDGIIIEDDVFIGPNVTFINDKYPKSKIYPFPFLRTIIRKGASIGGNATILGGITIGENAMIGAGSVVTKDVPSGELWLGNPAHKKGLAPPR
jgi:acetyltransferase-like isoleucine patch superfamily enzyme